MAVPKRKTSKAKRDSRRAPNMRVSAPNLAICPQCNSTRLPHKVCPVCGYYNGQKVVEDD